ncbi:hypothetical protein TCAL_16647 [Tigriopus californicus]|uniref:Transcription initiation factor IIA gamma subunit C-terminal domain-containing protein n=1 Tax=Tigriopus californicus TaxID=6832 RepID=A0A553NDT0_TIGCA|nr:hypothetical protein TCAL_16647 [Tigriopus californicus]
MIPLRGLKRPQSEEESWKILSTPKFDRSINTALSTRVKNKLNFKAEKLNTYRFCDNVWTFMLNDVEFREVSELAKIDRVKIVACDAKASNVTAGNRHDD